jgi:hypothetical protein
MRRLAQTFAQKRRNELDHGEPQTSGVTADLGVSGGGGTSFQPFGGPLDIFDFGQEKKGTGNDGALEESESVEIQLPTRPETPVVTPESPPIQTLKDPLAQAIDLAQDQLINPFESIIDKILKDDDDNLKKYFFKILSDIQQTITNPSSATSTHPTSAEDTAPNLIDASANLIKEILEIMFFMHYITFAYKIILVYSN